MKKFILILIIGCLTIYDSEAFETRVNFDTHSGRFVLFVNGERINNKPAQQLSLNHLRAGNNHLMIRYWNQGRPVVIRQRVFLQHGYETSFLVRRNRYGEIRLRETSSIRMSPQHYRSERCDVGNTEFRFMMEDLRRVRFDNRKYAIAMRYLDNYDLTSRQLARIVRQFSFDDTKVDFIINAYDFLADPYNIAITYDELRFSSSIRTLKQQLNLHSMHRGKNYPPGKAKGHYKGKGHNKYRNDH